MKKTSKILILLFSAAAVISCQREEAVKPVKAANHLKAAVWETVIDASSLASYSAFESKWSYLYPWGSDHNGSARMVGSSWDHSHIYLNGGVLSCKSTKVSGLGNIHYYSGTIYAKKQVLVTDQYPNWEVRGDFQCESQRGTWPAFWLTGASSWPPESDIMEFKGNTNCWQNTFRTSSDVTSTITAVSSPGSWHTYRVWIQKIDATNLQIHYYIDGVWKAQHTANFVGKPMWIILDYQMEGSSGSPGPNATTYMNAKNLYVGRTKAY